MNYLYIMCGLPFSGKTTLSKKVAEVCGFERVSFDETWVTIEKEKGNVPGGSSIERWKYVKDVCKDTVRRKLKEGKSVIYDDLSSTYKNRKEIEKVALEVGVKMKAIYIDVDKNEVIKRRITNSFTKVRNHVSDKNFNNALDNFENPRKDEEYLIYKPAQDINIWIEKNIRKINL